MVALGGGAGSYERGSVLQLDQVPELERRANVSHIRQSRPDFGHDFQTKDLDPFKMFPLRAEAARAFVSKRRVTLQESGT